MNSQIRSSADIGADARRMDLQIRDGAAEVDPVGEERKPRRQKSSMDDHDRFRSVHEPYSYRLSAKSELSFNVQLQAWTER